MFVRVVRFTDVDEDRVSRLLARVESEGGPPPGVTASGMQFLFDREQRTAVVLQHFASEADMEESAKVFAAMDPEETPGTRASVDACELRLELGS